VAPSFCNTYNKTLKGRISKKYVLNISGFLQAVNKKLANAGCTKVPVRY
jgi:hypothetical protein